MSKRSTSGRIYVYSAPGYETEWTRTTGSTTVNGKGKFKVGYTGRQDPKVRIKEQTGTLYPGQEGIVIHLDEEAVRADGTFFDDHEVHRVLDSVGINRISEVVEATLSEISAAIASVRSGRKYDASRTHDFGLRPEQDDAVSLTAKYFKSHENDPYPPRFLWNAKMRFGKTFATYKLAEKMQWKRILVLTYKPAVRDAWRDDLSTHIDFADWLFASRDSAVDPDDDKPIVWFASFQDLLGTTSTGGVKERNVDLHLIDWDCIVLDEYHFGAWQGAAKELCSTAPIKENSTKSEEEEEVERSEELSTLLELGTPRLYSANPEGESTDDLDAAQLRLSSKNYLYLSGTPFRALTEGEFNEDAIFNWTYPNEQQAKREWDEVATHDPNRNPYRELPQMQMFTYALPDLTTSDFDYGAEGLFDLSGFFAADKVGSEYQFKDAERVREFLNMLRGQLVQSAKEKLLSNSKPAFPYSNPMFAKAVEHTVWLLPTVASAHAMKAELETHPFFQNYLVHVAAGSGAKMGAEAKRPVDAMLSKAAKLGKQTITLSVAKLMTGVTVPQWGAILILRSLKAPESYFQAAFRVQSPWAIKNDDGTRTINKETCFVFDFDPNRALTLVYQYGTKLAGETTKSSPAETIHELIEHLPIFRFYGGSMDPVDVNAVMDWGTSRVGAAMLAKRWGSDRLIDLSESVLKKLLGQEQLLAQLEQMEDFRNLRQEASKIIENTNKARKPRTPDTDSSGHNDPEIDMAKKAKRDQVKTLRSKLKKFVQAVPVFMYLTDFREESLVHVISSLDTQLFERVTGITLADFNKLSDIGVFHPQHMDEAIWQFRLFERASLNYLGVGDDHDGEITVGLWDRSVSLVANTSN
jgi:hypothetical protein